MSGSPAAAGPSAADLPSPADLRSAVEKIGRVPDRYRVFSASPAEARRLLRIGPDVLAQALDLGLSSRGRGEDLRLDRLDLSNLAISLRLNAAWFAAMGSWLSAMESAATASVRRYRIAVCSRCPRCTRDRACTRRLSPLLVDAAERVEPSAGAWGDLDVTVGLAGCAVGFPPDVAEVLRLADPVEWHLVPDALSRDLSFLRETGLADCRLMAHYLHQQARRRGLPARPAYGLIVAVPFSREHNWVEFEVDGAWLPADPLFFNSMARWGCLDPTRWPPTTSPVGTTWRLGRDYEPLVTHDLLATSATLPTTRLVVAPAG